MKKSLSVLLLICMLLGMLSGTGFALRTENESGTDDLVVEEPADEQEEPISASEPEQEPVSESEPEPVEEPEAEEAPDEAIIGEELVISEEELLEEAEELLEQAEALAESSGELAEALPEDGDIKIVHYLDADGIDQVHDAGYTDVKDGMDLTWTSGWYVVSEDVTINGLVKCSGDVKLVLTDKSKLTFESGGIGVTYGNSLTIYAQSMDESIMGKLVATNPERYNAAIGGYYDNGTSGCGTITINGGSITVQGGYDAAGIGGGLNGSCFKVTVNGGVVSAGGYLRAIGDGAGGGMYSDVSAASYMLIEAGDSSTSQLTEITNSGGNIAGSLKNYKYVHIKMGKVTCRLTANGTTRQYTSVSSAAAGITYGGSGIVTLLQDIEENVTIPAYVNATIDLNGHVLSAPSGSGSVITNNGNLTIQDTSSDKKHYFTVGSDGLWTLNDENTSGAVALENLDARPAAGTVVAVTGGVITGGKGTLVYDKNQNRKYYGGGIYNYGSVTLKSGNIIGNMADRNGVGGGIFSYCKDVRTSVTVEGGSICGNYADGSAYLDFMSSGGGIYIYNGSVQITGGEISYNIAAYGGGICMEKNDSTITMSGGKINGNDSSWGAGIDLKYGSFTMSGGEICGNQGGGGAGIAIAYSTCNISGTAAISDNEGSYGGGINCQDSTCNISGTAEICDNIARKDGGGLFIQGVFGNSYCNISDQVSICGNKASRDGGGICIDNSNFYTVYCNISDDVSVSGNYAGNDGGGICNYESLTVTGGSITDNTSASSHSSGGLYTYRSTTYLGGKLNISGNTTNISGNTAKARAANLCISNDSRITLGTSTDGTDGNQIPKPAWTTPIGVTYLGTNANNARDVERSGRFTENGVATDLFTNDTEKYKAAYNEDGYWELVDAVCYIDDDNSGSYSPGETTYTTVQDAVDAADTQTATVVMSRDSSENVTIADGQTITLDLNGCVLSAENGSMNSVIEVKSGASLTVTDSGTTAEHYFTYRSADAWTYIPSPTNDQKNGADSVAEIDSKTEVVKVLGGCITGGVTGNGGGINNEGTLTVKGGNIVGNTALFNGGAVYNLGTSSKNAAFNFEGGSLAGNMATNGGAVHNDGTLTVSGGDIVCNMATNGGGIYADEAYSNTVITGGNISDNTADTNGGGIYLENGTLTMTGGSITDNAAGTLGGGVYNKGIVTLGGTAQITGNMAPGTTANNLYLPDDKTVTISTDTAPTTMRVGVTTETAPTKDTTKTPVENNPVAVTGNNGKDYSGNFTSDKLFDVYNDNNRVFLVKEIVAKIGEQTFLSVQEAIDAANSGDTIVMTADSTENVTIENKKITLDLNGHVLKAAESGTPESDSVIEVKSGASLTITDSGTSAEHYFTVGSDGLWTLDDGNTRGAVALKDLTDLPKAGTVVKVTGGCITDGTGEGGSNRGLGAGIYNSGTLTLSGGNVVGNAGGGIYNYCTMTMNGGAILGNTAEVWGGGVYTGTDDKKAASSFTMTGGQIFGNSAGEYGGGINVGKYCDVELSGGSISGNTAGKYGGGVYSFCLGTNPYVLGGNINITGNTLTDGTANNLYLNKDYTISVSGLTEDACIGVTVAEPPTLGSSVAITGTNDEDYSDRFSSDDAGGKIINDNNVVKLSAHVHEWSYTANGDTITATCANSDGLHSGETTASLTLSANICTYDGGAYTGASLAQSNWTGNGLEIPEIIYAGSDKTDYPESTAAPQNAGTYTASITVGGKTVSAAFFISPKKLQVEENTTLVADKVYDGTTDAVVTAGKLIGVVGDDGTDEQVNVQEEVAAAEPTDGAAGGADEVTLTAVGHFENKNVGESKIVTVVYSLSGADAANYDAPDNQSVCAAITPKPITVTAADKSSVCGSSLVELTYSVEPVLCEGDSMSGRLTTDADINTCGQYTITQGTLSAGDNYALSFVPASYTVSDKTDEDTDDKPDDKSTEAKSENVPDTGDNGAIGLWLSAALLGAATLGGIALCRRREN